MHANLMGTPCHQPQKHQRPAAAPAQHPGGQEAVRHEHQQHRQRDGRWDARRQCRHPRMDIPHGHPRPRPPSPRAPPADPAARGASPEQPAQIPPLDRAQVEQSAGFHYAHEAATRLPSKLTATQLKGRFLDAEAAEQAPAEPQRRPWRTPQFLQDRPLTGREKGSATHLFMQFVRYEACTDEPGVRAELQRLQAQKFLTPRQAEAVDVQKILRLFSSPLGKTLLSAKTLRREFKFSILTDAEAYSPEAAGEQVMLQGVVDCFWQEPDGIVILDFKTDYIDGDLQQKAERYAPQLHAYAAALSRIFQTPVKKTILYFFSANQPIEI